MKLKVNIPRSKQLTGSYCGPAVFEMLVSSLGKTVYQEAIVDASEAREKVMKVGITLNELSKGLAKLHPDLKVWGKTNSKLDDVQKLLELGYPVAVDWQGIFTRDEYEDDEYDKWGDFWDRMTGAPVLKGDQGHYCVALEIDLKKGYLRFADPYGHYAGKDRFVALWEFEERWWDDRIDKDERGRKKYVLENRLMFLITTKEDKFPATLGMSKV